MSARHQRTRRKPKSPTSLRQIDDMLSKVQIKQRASVPISIISVSNEKEQGALDWADSDDEDSSFQLPDDWKAAPSNDVEAFPEPSEVEQAPWTNPDPLETPRKELFPSSIPSQPVHMLSHDKPKARRKPDARETGAFGRLAKGLMGGQQQSQHKPVEEHIEQKAIDEKQKVEEKAATPPKKGLSLLERLEPRDVSFLNDVEKEEEPSKPIVTAASPRKPPTRSVHQEKPSLLLQKELQKVHLQEPPSQQQQQPVEKPAIVLEKPIIAPKKPASGLSSSRWAT